MINYFNKSKIKIFKSKYFIKNIDQLDKNSKYLIFSGIGNPQNFKKILENSNFKVVTKLSFLIIIII